MGFWGACERTDTKKPEPFVIMLSKLEPILDKCEFFYNINKYEKSQFSKGHGLANNIKYFEFLRHIWKILKINKTYDNKANN